MQWETRWSKSKMLSLLEFVFPFSISCLLAEKFHADHDILERKTR